MYFPNIPSLQFQAPTVFDTNSFDDSDINFRIMDFPKRNTDVVDIENDELVSLRNRYGSTSSENSYESGDSFESTTSNGRLNASDMQKYLFTAPHPV